MVSVGERIRYFRELKGLSQSDLASLVGYSHYTQVGRAEKGLTSLTPAKLRRYAEALGVTVEQLQGEEAPPAPGPQSGNPIVANLMASISQMTDGELIRLAAEAQAILRARPDDV